MKIARAIRNGLIVSGTGKAAKTAKPKAYAIWDEADEPREDHPMHIPPPKMTLPRTRPFIVHKETEEILHEKQNIMNHTIRPKNISCLQKS
jgi:hypothetical protein